MYSQCLDPSHTRKHSSMKRCRLRFQLLYPLIATTLLTALSVNLGAALQPARAQVVESETQAKATAEASRQQLELFRRLFAWHHKQEKGYLKSWTRDSVFMAPRSYLQPPLANSPEMHFQELTKRFSSATPLEWYQEGKQVKIKAQKPSTLSPAQPATIIVIPGIFGEFIEQLPFQEVLNTPSQFRERFQAKLDGLEGQVYSTYELGQSERSLGELVKVGSIDIDGRPHVNIIVLRALAGSLETLGSLKSNTEVYLRRLNRVLPAIETHDLYVLGYSRGLNVALDVASHAAKEPEVYRWADRIKGVIGLGGTFYGAAIAEAALSSADSPTGAALVVLQDLVAKLHDTPHVDPAEDLKQRTQNTRAWVDAAARLAEIGQLGTSLHGEDFDLQAAVDLAKQSDADPLEIAAGLKEVMTREYAERDTYYDIARPQLFGNLNLLVTFMFRTFRFQNFFSRYYENIQAFKILIQAALTGAETLTPKARADWWNTHSLPEDIKIFSITGSMPDAYQAEALPKLFRLRGYGHQMVDFNQALRSSFYDVLGAEHTQMNDSQVSAYRSRFWPGLYGHNYEHHYVATLGTHHWGMAFPFAISDSQGANLFPRSTLMATLASYIYEID